MPDLSLRVSASLRSIRSVATRLVLAGVVALFAAAPAFAQQGSADAAATPAASTATLKKDADAVAKSAHSVSADEKSKLKAAGKQAEADGKAALKDAEAQLKAAGEQATAHTEAAKAEGAEAHAAATAHAEGHAPAKAEDAPPPELPHFVELFYHHFEHQQHENPGAEPSAGYKFFKLLQKGPLEEPLPIVKKLPWLDHIFVFIACLILIAVFSLGTRNLSLRNPSRAQIFIENIVGGFTSFVSSILGPEHGKRYAPYIMTLFMFILMNNWMGMIPLMKAPTPSLVLTGSLALITFCVVQYTAITKLGVGTYIHHLLGSPTNAVMWAMAPLFLLLHIIGEFAKPISLALRLFGNSKGEDILLGAFLMMGMSLMATLGWQNPMIGVPLHFPFLFLVLLLSTIQAVVFSLLTTIYILMVLPHDHGHGHDDHGHDHGHDHGAAHGAAKHAH